jgi:hypothetical protein
MTVQAHPQDTAVRYRAYGQVLSCSTPVPELEQTPALNTSKEQADLHILFASAAEPIPRPVTWYLTIPLENGAPWLRCAKIDRSYLVQFPSLASFLFTPLDKSIRCIPYRDTPTNTVHHLLLDHVLPLVLNYRGMEVLHGAAVVTPSGACAFVGQTGMGKSTLAASFLTAGYSIVADDCVVLEIRGDDIVTIPAYPGLRLWDDAIAELFGTTGTGAPMAHYTPKQRFTAAVSTTPVCSSPIPLAGIYVIEGPSETDAALASVLERPLLTKRDALMRLLSLAFKLDIEDRHRLTREFDFLHHLVTQTPIRRLIIPNSFEALPALRAGILQDLGRPC